MDWKYLSAAVILLLLLFVAGLFQLNPPAEQQEQVTPSYSGNTLLALDLLCEESFKETPGAKEMLIKYLDHEGFHKECAIWENPGVQQ